MIRYATVKCIWTCSDLRMTPTPSVELCIIVLRSLAAQCRQMGTHNAVLMVQDRPSLEASCRRDEEREMRSESSEESWRAVSTILTADLSIPATPLLKVESMMSRMPSPHTYLRMPIPSTAPLLFVHPCRHNRDRKESRKKRGKKCHYPLQLEIESVVNPPLHTHAQTV